MSNRMWEILSWFVAIIIITGGFTLAYFGERGKLGIFETNIFVRSSIILVGFCGVFFFVLSEVRKRRDGVVDARAIGITLGILIVAFFFMYVTRVLL